MKLGIDIGAALAMLGIGFLVAIPLSYAVDCAGGNCTELNLYGTAPGVANQWAQYWLLLLVGPALSTLGAIVLWRQTGSPLIPGIIILAGGMAAWLAAPSAKLCQAVGDLASCAGGDVPLVGISLLMVFVGAGMVSAGSVRFMKARVTFGILFALLGIAMFAKDSIRVESSGPLQLFLFGIGLAVIIGSQMAPAVARRAAGSRQGHVVSASA